MGRVRSFHNRYGKIPARILRVHAHPRGYIYVGLMKDGVRFHFKVHRLVAEAFIPNPENKPCVDHIDTNKSNNTVSNLRWCTIKENMNNPITIEKFKEIHDGSVITDLWNRGKMERNRRRVAQYTKDGELIRVWDAAVNAARELNLCKQTIYECCWGSKKTCGGFKWGYIEAGSKTSSRPFVK